MIDRLLQMMQACSGTVGKRLPLKIDLSGDPWNLWNPILFDTMLKARRSTIGLSNIIIVHVRRWHFGDGSFA